MWALRCIQNYSFSCCLVAHNLCTTFPCSRCGNMWALKCVQNDSFLLLLLTGMARELCTVSFYFIAISVSVWVQGFGEDSSVLFLFLIVRSLIWVLCSRAISFSVIFNSLFLLTKNVNRDPQQTPSTDCFCSCCLHSLFSGTQKSRMTRLQSHSLIWIWFSDALRQQKPYGLLGTAEKEDWEPRSTILFTKLWVLI